MATASYVRLQNRSDVRNETVGFGRLKYADEVRVARGMAELAAEGRMSERNGDRARFQKNRKRKLRRRQRVQALAIRLRTPAQGLGAGETPRLNAS